MVDKLPEMQARYKTLMLFKLLWKGIKLQIAESFRLITFQLPCLIFTNH